MRYAIVVGTRPEGIKLAPLIDLLGEAAVVIHTGQHSSIGMTGQARADIVLAHRISGVSRGQQLGTLTGELDDQFSQLPLAAVIVQGDTTSALAGALAANANHTPLVHVEAGLRSYDRAMPEEHNRVLIDHLADFCCAPTQLARGNLLAEGIAAARIVVTGNTIVEAAWDALPDAHQQESLLAQLGIAGEPYILATLHRPENADAPVVLRTLLDQLAELPARVVMPLHPRTRRMLMANELWAYADRLRITEPLDYPDALTLLRHAAIVITDSGGIQEEATVFKKPIVVLRRSNERPEVENEFGVRLQPGDPIAPVVMRWLTSLPELNARLAVLPSPYGDGTASRAIAKTLTLLPDHARQPAANRRTEHARLLGRPA